MKAARVEAARAVSTFTMAAVEARKLAGDVVPMDASPAGVGKLAFTLRVPIGDRRRDLAVQLPVQPRRAQDRSRARRGLRRRPEARVADAALGAAPRRARDGGRAAGRVAQRRVRSAGEIGDVLVEDERVKLITFTGSVGVGWKLRERAARKRVNLELGNATPVIVASDADLDDAATRLAANAFSFAGQSCISVQRIYVERPPTTHSSSAFFHASRRSKSATLRTRRPTSAR